VVNHTNTDIFTIMYNRVKSGSYRMALSNTHFLSSSSKKLGRLF